MSIEINYLENGAGIEIIASGTVTGSEIIESHKEIYNAEIDKKASDTNPNIVVAIVASTDLQFGMSRVWQVYVEKSKFVTKVFRDREDAESWLKEKLGKT
jgi:hypothetical protein